MMRKYMYLPILLLMVCSCDSNTYESIEEPSAITGKVTYENNVKSIIDGNCIVCHSAGGLASFRPFNTYAQIKEGVQETNLLDRIQRQNGEPGQMPKTGRMPQAKINTILRWSADGLLEN